MEMLCTSTPYGFGGSWKGSTQDSRTTLRIPRIHVRIKRIHKKKGYFRHNLDQVLEGGVHGEFILRQESLVVSGRTAVAIGGTRPGTDFWPALKSTSLWHPWLR